MIRLILLVVAFVCFAFGAYVAPDKNAKLVPIGLAAATLAFLLAGVV